MRLSPAKTPPFHLRLRLILIILEPFWFVFSSTKPFLAYSLTLSQPLLALAKLSDLTLAPSSPLARQALLRETASQL